jgi:peptide/nickel transport system permease protein
VRYSLGISVLIVVGAAVIGTVIGGLAGLIRGPIDSVLMRTTDVFLAFPYLILAIAIASAVGPGLTTVVVALTAVWWPGYARMVRGQVLALKELAFVEGARAAGTSTPMILLRHLLPHLLPQLSARRRRSWARSSQAHGAICSKPGGTRRCQVSLSWRRCFHRCL